MAENLLGATLRVREKACSVGSYSRPEVPMLSQAISSSFEGAGCARPALLVSSWAGVGGGALA